MSCIVSHLFIPQLPTLASLFSLFTYKFLQYLIGVYSARRVRVGRPALTAKESLETEFDKNQKKKFDARDRQQRALQVCERSNNINIRTFSATQVAR
jgi:hypothetical protein